MFFAREASQWRSLPTTAMLAAFPHPSQWGIKELRVGAGRGLRSKGSLTPLFPHSVPLGGDAGQDEHHGLQC